MNDSNVKKYRKDTEGFKVCFSKEGSVSEAERQRWEWREASEAGVSQSAGGETRALSLLSLYFETVFREQGRPCLSLPTPRARRSPQSKAPTAAPDGLMPCTVGTWSTYGNTQKILERLVAQKSLVLENQI